MVEGLRLVAPATQREVQAARAVWPALAAGLPSRPSSSLLTAAKRCAALAAGLPEPGFMSEASKLTGPAAGIAGSYEAFARLSERGCRLTSDTVETVLSAKPKAVRFAKQNSALYIDAIYDGHYDLSLLGKSLATGYERLGGSKAFGPRLPAAALGRLARLYSIAAVRLSPHPGPGAELG